MGRIKIIKKGSEAYLQLPSEFENLDELEMFALRDGYYLLSVPLDNAELKTNNQKPITNNLSENEKLLLKNLLSIKFEKRTPKNIDKMLEDNERVLLANLIKNGFVNVFKSKKYPDGVYNISDKVYPLLRENKQITKPTEQKVEPKTKENIKPSTISNTSNSNYRIISNPQEAYLFSQEIKKSGRDRDFICLRSFDGRFYAVSKRYFTANSENVKDALKNEGNIAAIAKLCNIELEGCRALLNVLSDRGDVIEKRKDTFVLV